MTTPAQVEANRANSAHSTGPVTAAGKEAVSRNSTTHGLSATKFIALPGENEALAKHVAGYLEFYAPVGDPETDLVTNIAENHFRLKRAHAMETALFEQIALQSSAELDPASAHAQAFIDATKGLQRVALYAGRIQRAIEKNTAALEAMQSARKAAYAKAQTEAILLLQLAHSQGNQFDPAAAFPDPAQCGGFVFSSNDLGRVLLRACRLEEAKALFNEVH